MTDRDLALKIAEVLSDVTTFSSLIEIKLKSGGMVPFNFERWNVEQKRFHRERTGRDIVIKPRQIGFTTEELARDLQFAVERSGVNVQVVVHDKEIKEQLFLNLRVMGECLKRRGLLPRTRYSTKTELVFADTGSAVRIVESGATELAAQKKGRSGTIHRLHATEMAFWGQASETWNALSAATPDTAEVVIESTANGAGGLFYDMVQAALEGRGRYKVHFFAWYEHLTYRMPVPLGFDPAPRNKWEEKLRSLGCDDQQIAWWRSKADSVEIGLDKALQEFPVDAQSCFRVAGRQYFEPDVIDAIFERVVAPLRRAEIRFDPKQPEAVNPDAGRLLGELLVYEEPRPGRDYVIGGDVSEGTGLDGHAMTVVDALSARTVATFSADNIEPGDFGTAMAVVGRMFNEALLAPERNNHGHAAIRAIVKEADYPVGRVYQAADGKLGWETNSVTRPVMIDEFGSAVRTGVVFTPDRATASECKTLVRNEKGKVEARGKSKKTKDASKDDRVISWCIALQVRSTPSRELQRVHIPGY